jgi:hypothetical protein
MPSYRPQRRSTSAGLVEERKAGVLAALKTERAASAAKGVQIETEAAPIRYVAELVGMDNPTVSGRLGG